VPFYLFNVFMLILLFTIAYWDYWVKIHVQLVFMSLSKSLINTKSKMLPGEKFMVKFITKYIMDMVPSELYSVLCIFAVRLKPTKLVVIDDMHWFVPHLWFTYFYQIYNAKQDKTNLYIVQCPINIILWIKSGLGHNRSGMYYFVLQSTVLCSYKSKSEM
jgi:hypothetical protein